MLKIRILIIILFIPCAVISQVYKGKVVEMDTGLPIQNVNVFLAGTSRGTTTMPNGEFSLDTKGSTSIPLVFSFIGYKVKTISISELEISPLVRLEKDSIQISEIDVKSGKSGWPRGRMLNVFKEEFLGTSFNAQACELKNKKDLYLFYNSETRTLHAHSKRPLIIENNMLGYTVYYSLEYFRMSEKGIQFKGYSRFEERDFRNERQKRRIEIHRKETYLGSIMHIIRFLYQQNLTERDTIYDLATIAAMYEYRLSSQELLRERYKTGDLSNTDVVVMNETNNINRQKCEDKFQMYDDSNKYLSCKEMLSDTLGHRYICFNDTVQIVYLGNLKASFLIPKSDSIEIFEDGYYNPEQIGWYGSVIKNRVGDLLPLDYKYDHSILKKK